MYELAGLSTQSQLYHAPEACAWCDAIGSVDGGSCPSCNGKGYVVTLQPGLPCSVCDGTGRSVERLNRAISAPCEICGGCGWLIRTAR